MYKLLITDLDDTLYNWLDFFVPSFYSMADEVSKISGINIDVLLDEYRAKHQEYGSVEYPFVTLHLPSITEKYSTCSEDELKTIFSEAFHKFNSERKKRLQLFDGVFETLKELFDKGIIIIGYTESSQENGYYRLKKLEIDSFFKHVYATKSSFINTDYSIDTKVKSISSKKPDKDVLIEICKKEGCDVSEAIYLGDSLTKDILMAQKAGITSVWANYPKTKNDYYKKLVKISSWTESDFTREQELKRYWENNNLTPNYTISHFDELLRIVFSSNEL